MVRVNNLSYFYPDGYKPLECVSFDIEKGSSVGIAGANGAGKSTLLYLISGVIIPEIGEITIDGVRSSKQNIREIRKRTGLVFQDSDDQLFTTTVYDDIAFGPRNMGFSEEEVKRKVSDALNLCNISGMEKRAPYKLSGGEKKMAAIATIIAMEPEILIMDEPSASLDPRARRNVIKLLSTIPKTRIIASHDLDMIWELCDKVIILQGGRVVASGDTRQILSDEGLLTNADLELPIRLSGKY